MNNQKFNYRKILTSERLPKEGLQTTNKGEFNFNYWAEQYTPDIIYPDWWLEEIPNREEELADLLEEALNLLDDFPYEQSLQERRANLTMNAQNIIWEIKNNAPKLLDDDTN